MILKGKENIDSASSGSPYKFSGEQNWLVTDKSKRKKNHLSIVLPVKMTGKYLEYFPTPNLSPK